jgi:3-oxoacyl-(acyl-carrier-protein) synthase
LVSSLGPTLAATHAALRAGARSGYVLGGLALDTASPLRGHPVSALEPAAPASGAGATRRMSAAMQMLHAAAHAALVQARLAGDRRRLSSFGIVIGAHSGERTSREELSTLQRVVDADGRLDATRYADALLARAPRSALKAQPGLLAGMLALTHHVEGPCLTVIDDGVAGARAIAEAYHAIADRWCERWIAGAAFDLDDPWILLTRGRSAPALGSAAAALVLESQAAADRRGALVRATVTLEGAETSHGRAEGDELAASFAALRIAERLGDTLAAALPVAIALAVQHVDPANRSGGEGRPMQRPVLRIGSVGSALVFLVGAPPSVARSHAEESDGARAAAGALDAR